MPLNKLDNFLKNVEGRILYVSPSDLDASDAMTNQGNSQTAPFKTVQRALIESARFSYVQGNNNDITEKTTILLMPGEHIIDNRPGFKIKKNGNNAQILDQTGATVPTDSLSLNLESNFDLNDKDNLLHKFNSAEGGVIVPRGTSIVGLDLRKTKIIPKYVPNPTDTDVPNSAIFRITGACYFWQFSIFDAKESDKVYTDNKDFTEGKLSIPTFSHHKLTVFEYADGVNEDTQTSLTDLNMYYYKLSLAYGDQTNNRNIPDKFPASTEGFAARRPEFEIVGAFAADPIKLVSVESGSGGNVSSVVTVFTEQDHNLDVGTPIKISGVTPLEYNVSSKVTSVDPANPKKFTYTLESVPNELTTPASNVSGATATVETDTVGGASPYIFNISLRSVYGMNGMHADGSKSTGFRSMVVAQFTGVSLQKDDRAFVKYSQQNREYSGLDVTPVFGETLSVESSATDPNKVFHFDSDAIYRNGWETRHVKISNNSILQIVSVFAIGYNTHFECQSGADASITNSNSNFGQLALVSDGFRKDAFEKDDRAFITHVIPPRAITTAEENIDWVSIDVGVTTAVADDKRLYLFGFTSEDIKPPAVTQGFRIGAKLNDKLFVNVDGVDKEANIFMEDGTANPSVTSVKETRISSLSNSVFTAVAGHKLTDGEKIILISDDGDLPENVEEKTIYFAIVDSPSQFKIASSKTNADNEEFIRVYGGTNLKVLSRVSDKNSGDIGHPVEFDSSQGQWFINVNVGNNIYSAINSLGVSGLGARTEPSFVKRVADTRGLDDKIYKVRLSIPKEISNSKNPENGFIIQESSTTGVRTDGDFTKNDALGRDDFGFERNPRFISSCTFNNASKIVTITAERPHDLKIGDSVTVKNVKDTTNTNGTIDKGYNGQFTITGIPNSLTFQYSTGDVTIPSFATNDFDVKVSSFPRFERTDLKSNIYLFRNTIVSQYIDGTQDGVYQVFALNSSNFIPNEYTGLNYSQNVVDLYPQLDRDNVSENPPASQSFAVRSPLGQVVTSDPLKSLTRETNDKLMKDIGVGNTVFSFTDSSITGIVSFTGEHNFAGIMTATIHSGGASYTNGTHLNVKVFNSVTQNDTTWNGTLAKVVVGGGAVDSFEITNAGSGWTSGDKGYFDTSRIAGNGVAVLDGAVSGAGLTSGNIGVSTDLVLQFTGIGVTSDSYFRLKQVNNKKEITVHKSISDVNPIQNQYAFVVSPSSHISGKTFNSGITTVTTTQPHGLVAGNRFQLNDASNVNQGTFIVKTKVNVNSFTFETSSDLAAQGGYILKHGLSANDGVSEENNENLAVRGVDLFDLEHGKLSSQMISSAGKFVIDSSNNHNLLQRFPYGSYVIIDEEIMRVSTNTLQGTSNNEISVIRGVFGTLIQTHETGSLIKKIKAFPIQFNRPSIIRASGHTFEYLGYGPGNYSTALPQVQVKTISEKEEFLSQSQERAGGAVVYTGMNNKGDFYIGNQKKSALTGEETSFDTPIPSVTGEDPGRLSVVFDEATIKERIVVEGGKSKTALSEFDGPVTFNNEVRIKDKLDISGKTKFTDTTQATSSTDASVIFNGGVGFNTHSIFADNAILKFGNDGDLQISHTSDVSLIKETRTGVGATLAIGADKLILRNKDGDENYLEAINDGSLKLFHDSATKLETTGYGVTVSGIVSATSFNGDGSNLTGIDKDKLIDTGGTTRAEAIGSGVTISGTLRATTSNVNTPAIIATNTAGQNSIIQRWVSVDGRSRNLEVQQPASFGDYQIVNTGEKLNGIRFYDGGNGVRILYDDEFRFDVRDTQVRVGDPTLSDVDLLVTGDIFAFSSSDIRLKDNISPITKALEKVKSISGNTYTKKSDGSAHTGVIAQEIEALGLPGITTTRSSGFLAVDYEKLVPLLIEAIKELNVKVDNMKEKLNDHCKCDNCHGSHK